MKTTSLRIMALNFRRKDGVAQIGGIVVSGGWGKRPWR
jgi:hypothetical protein